MFEDFRGAGLEGLAGRRSTRWLGHVARMAPTRLARQTLFGFAKGRSQLKTGRRRNLVAHAKATLKGLPTSATGLETGALYNDGGTIKVA